MPRENLFRVKRIDSGKWMYFSQDETVGMENVIPDTVGQYIRYNDRNGNKIFVGDIVKYHTEDGEYLIGEVVFSNFLPSFAVRLKNCNTQLVEYMHIMRGSERVEIIGSIYDNLELLEEKNEEN